MFNYEPRLDPRSRGAARRDESIGNEQLKLRFVVSSADFALRACQCSGRICRRHGFAVGRAIQLNRLWRWIDSFSISTIANWRFCFEQAGEFAEEYPGIAERLGGLVAERMDPMAGALLEGTAFHRWPACSSSSNRNSRSLRAICSINWSRTASPPRRRSCWQRSIRSSPIFGPGQRRSASGVDAYFDATYRERERAASHAVIACAARSCCGPSIFWLPNTCPSPGPMQAAGLSVGHNVLSGLRRCR